MRYDSFFVFFGYFIAFVANYLPNSIVIVCLFGDLFLLWICSLWENVSCETFETSEIFCDCFLCRRWCKRFRLRMLWQWVFCLCLWVETFRDVESWARGSGFESDRERLWIGNFSLAMRYFGRPAWRSDGILGDWQHLIYVWFENVSRETFCTSALIRNRHFARELMNTVWPHDSSGI